VYDAIVVAGGTARRLGGVDKPGLRIGGVALLDRVVGAVAGASRTVVVGPTRELARPVLWCREEPVGGGPVAAIGAALAQVKAPTVVVLAADLPWVAPAVTVLLAALVDAPAAVLVSAGRPNYLCAAWRRSALDAAVASIGPLAGAAVRQLFAGVATAPVIDDHGWGRDCDTWDDLAQARREAADRPASAQPRTDSSPA
jgi:molybdopterin-guanine dinucleotide biosynthesis protein A